MATNLHWGPELQAKKKKTASCTKKLGDEIQAGSEIDIASAETLHKFNEPNMPQMATYLAAPRRAFGCNRIHTFAIVCLPPLVARGKRKTASNTGSSFSAQQLS